MSPREFEKWSRARERGAVRYIAFWGVCVYGSFMFLATYLVPVLLGYGDFHPGNALDSFVKWSATGVPVAAAAWLGCEWRYKRMEAQDSA